MDMITLATGRVIGDGCRPYVIAEIGANHNGNITLAKRLIEAARTAGADAVKFQSWTVDSLISKAEYQRQTEYSDKKRHFGSLRDMVERYQLTRKQHQELAEYCSDQGVDFLSTPFSPAEVDLLESLDVPAFKVASMDINHLPLLEYIAGKGRPVFLSTGMSTLAEVARAVDTLRDAGAEELVLLHCVSVYPPDPQTVNLRNIAGLRDAFDVPVGFSDHTLGTAVPLAAVAMGAAVIEKHFTLDKDLEGWDHAISADPAELAALVAGASEVFQALGERVRVVSTAELEKRRQFRRRLVLRRAVARDAVVRAEDLDFKRPGTGIGPDELSYVVGRKAGRDLAAEEELEWADLE